MFLAHCPNHLAKCQGNATGEVIRSPSPKNLLFWLSIDYLASIRDWLWLALTVSQLLPFLKVLFEMRDLTEKSHLSSLEITWKLFGGRLGLCWGLTVTEGSYVLAIFVMMTF